MSDGSAGFLLRWHQAALGRGYRAVVLVQGAVSPSPLCWQNPAPGGGSPEALHSSCWLSIRGHCQVLVMWQDMATDLAAVLLQGQPASQVKPDNRRSVVPLPSHTV